MSLVIPDRNYNQRIFRDFSTKFTNQYPSFHQYVAVLKQQKQLDYKNFLNQRLEAKREEEMLLQEKFRQEQQKEKMQKLNELEEKIKTTKKRIKDHDDGLRKKQQETLNKKLVVVNQYITNKARYYEDSRKYYPRVQKYGGQKNIDGSLSALYSQFNGSTAQRKVTYEDQISENPTLVTEIGLQSTPYHDYKVNQVQQDKKKLKNMEKIVHEAKMIPKKSVVAQMNNIQNEARKRDSEPMNPRAPRISPKKLLGQR